MTARFDQEELEAVKARTPLSAVLRQCGVKLKGRGAVQWALSPFNAEKTASFKCDDRRGFYHCFSSGQHGDHFDAVMALTGRSFREAVELLGGVAPLSDGERQALRQRERARAAAERQTEAADQASAERLFAAAGPLTGSPAEAYLGARGLVLPDGFGADLRFVAALLYRGFPSAEADATAPLGRFPAMLAAIRDQGGAIVGLHRTYLDPAAPRKLTPPGDTNRNGAKKILGSSRGMIWLSRRTHHVVTGEGIESTLSGHHLGIGSAEAGYAAGVSLGTIAGAATGTVPHPDFPDDPCRRLPNGVPDHDRPGLVLPPIVEHVTILVDGDSERCLTWARICVAGRRFTELERTVTIACAPAGQDHNDVWRAMRGVG